MFCVGRFDFSPYWHYFRSNFLACQNLPYPPKTAGCHLVTCSEPKDPHSQPALVLPTESLKFTQLWLLWVEISSFLVHSRIWIKINKYIRIWTVLQNIVCFHKLRFLYFPPPSCQSMLLLIKCKHIMLLEIPPHDHFRVWEWLSYLCQKCGLVSVVQDHGSTHREMKTCIHQIIWIYQPHFLACIITFWNGCLLNYKSHWLYLQVAFFKKQHITDKASLTHHFDSIFDIHL